MPTDAPILPTVRTPADLREMPIEDLERLADEMRAAIFDAVRGNGGHLASNLGVVELTIALHRVYDFGPYPVGPDRLVLDVGHQCYPHKMLTGRQDGFGKLRKDGGVGGFPMPDESDYDLFNVGHAGTAVSTAVGLARGDQAADRKNHVVAVVGDASIVNGLAFEGLNNAGTLDRQLLVILNDNGMSISGPQGAFAEYLERVRVSTTYEEFKKASKAVLNATLPEGVSHAVEAAWRSVTSGAKAAMWPGAFYEALGLTYMGPIDGHDLPELVQFLGEIQHVDKPVLLHVKTNKGRGIEAAEADPTSLHSPAAFRVEGCRVELNKASGVSWTKAFADAAVDLAREDERVWALTAAMPDGTGLSKFSKEIPERFIDTGICESHLMAMAAGMAKAGRKPLAAVYSTFTQRCFDQIWQEVVLNRLPVVLAMDRAGFVGSDGAVHHGFCDQSFLRPMPDAVLMAPSDAAELQRMLRLAMDAECFAALRYPRDDVPAADYETVVAMDLREAAGSIALGRSRLLRHGADATILAYGTCVADALVAAETLQREDGLDVAVVDARFCKPMDVAMVRRALETGPVLTVEDHAVEGGFGSAVLESAASLRLDTSRITRLGHPADRLIGHKSRAAQLAEAGIDALGITRALRSATSDNTSAGSADRISRQIERVETLAIH
jgi:1-deoxy-D-xylulose-5-phosphate synthase